MSVRQEFINKSLIVAREKANELINNYVKIYPHKTKVYVYNRPYMKKKDYLDRDRRQLPPRSGCSVGASDLSRSLRRSRTAISDVVLSNRFDLWVTFTFASERQDIVKCKAKMRNWLKSQQKTYGKFSYLLVIEFHKDKKSIHFHGFFKGYKGKLKKAINKKTNKKVKDRFGNQIYNITSYRSGFTTAVHMPTNEEEIDKVSNYVRKYMTKQLHDTMKDLTNKKRYWVSNDVKRPIIKTNKKIKTKNTNIIHEDKYYKILEIIH